MELVVFLLYSMGQTESEEEESLLMKGVQWDR